MIAAIFGGYILTSLAAIALAVMLTMFGALQYLGTLMAPVLGVTAQRVGVKKTYCALRLAYTLLAAVTMTLALTGVLMPWQVFVIGACISVIRPADLVLRYQNEVAHAKPAIAADVAWRMTFAMFAQQVMFEDQEVSGVAIGDKALVRELARCLTAYLTSAA